MTTSELPSNIRRRWKEQAGLSAEIGLSEDSGAGAEIKRRQKHPEETEKVHSSSIALLSGLVYEEGERKAQGPTFSSSVFTVNGDPMSFFGKVPLSTRVIVPADEPLGWIVISIPFCSKHVNPHFHGGHRSKVVNSGDHLNGTVSWHRPRAWQKTRALGAH
jgi:hypothetical protein